MQPMVMQNFNAGGGGANGARFAPLDDDDGAGAKTAPITRCRACGWALVPWCLLAFLGTMIGFLVWFMIAVMPDLITATRNVSQTTTAVNARAGAYLNQTDALMVYVNPTDVRHLASIIMQTGMQGLPFLGAALSELASKSGRVINWTAAGVAVSDMVDLLAVTATQTKKKGLTITLLQPSGE